MADEPVVEPVVKPVDTVVGSAVEPEAVVEPSPEPHPLAEGGTRFNEVYARMKQAEERAARIEGMLAQQQRPQTQPQYTPEQVAAYLQQQVDRGEITPMQGSNALSQFNAQRIANLTAVQTIQLLKPAIYVKGADSRFNPTQGLQDESDAIAAVGGKLMFTDEVTYHSTDLVRMMRGEVDAYAEAAT